MSPRQAHHLSIEHALLGFLHDRPLHGYELHQRLQAAYEQGFVWYLKQANMYALLGKLEADGLIEAEHLPQDTRPPKRLLHMTQAGRAAFATWLSSAVLHGRDIRIEFLTKLFWAKHIGLDATHQLIAAQRSVIEGLLAELSTPPVDSRNSYLVLVQQYRQGQLAAFLRWLDTCETTLVPALA